MTKPLENIQVDAVITWVDGNDKNWQKKINTYSDSKINFSSENHLKRYNSIGEIDIAIKSIIKFAPFIKNIFLVTDNQSPESFDSLKSLA
ncbi:MAG: Stealth CR1 domain-containing protein, partial [Salegentibacter mishustinae]|nr:Stealth CR1 domain-containing protein [Salegentibacter mishustinae]